MRSETLPGALHLLDQQLKLAEIFCTYSTLRVFEYADAQRSGDDVEDQG